MKKVLYITNKSVPYRVKFFNELSKKTDLMVLYGQSSVNERNVDWMNSVNINHKSIFIRDSSFLKLGFKLAEFVIKNYNKFDEIILGCCNEKAQMILYLILCIFKKKFAVNLDGEIFFNDCNLKLFIKKLFIKGGNNFYIAGKKSTKNTRRILGKGNVKYIPYYFSSLTKKEIQQNAKKSKVAKRYNFILVVGQYADYKGLDIALKVAKLLPNQKFKFIGTNNKTKEFKDLCKKMGVKNVEVISFLQKEALEKEYLSCKAFMLPSRRECWGLVVNEAASYGTPIISTYGSGAAVEFLSDKYPEFLATSNNVNSLKNAVKQFLCKDEKFITEYSNYLLEISKKYTIEKMVTVHSKLY